MTTQLGYYVLYKLIDNETEKVVHVGKYSIKATGDRLIQEAAENNVRLEIIDESEDLVEVTKDIRLLKIKYGVIKDADTGSRKLKIKDRKKSKFHNGKENYFVDYKIENGSYVTFKIETPLEFLSTRA